MHNGDFYFNTGSLDGNEMIRQFIDVVTSYETIGVNIFGIVSDGGGGNAKFFKLLRDNLPISGSGVNMNCFWCKNPIDPSRFIYFWSCGTHSMKSIRNNLFRSQPKLTRDFTKKGITFGWKHMEDIFLRDEERVKWHKGRRTDIVKHAIQLDKYTLMNAGYAKQPFSEKSISEVISHPSIHLSKLILIYLMNHNGIIFLHDTVVSQRF